MLDHHQSIGLAEKRLFPLNYTPKRSQSLKTIDFVPVADFTPNPVRDAAGLQPVCAHCERFIAFICGGRTRLNHAGPIDDTGRPCHKQPDRKQAFEASVCRPPVSE